MIRVLIADDEMLVRIGLKAAIDWEKYGFVIIGEVGNGWDALAQIRQGGVDIVLLDIRMPILDGIEVLSAIRLENLAVKVIILSVHEESEYVQKALKLGAFDYMLKLSLQSDKLLRTLMKARDAIEPKCDSYPESKEILSECWLRLFKKYDLNTLLEIQRNGYQLKEGKVAVLCLLIEQEDIVSSTFGNSSTVSPKYIIGIASDVINSYANGDCIEFEPRLYIAIINPRFADEQHLIAIAQAVSESMSRYAHCNVSIGISDIYTSVDKLGLALEAAKMSLEKRYVLGKNCISTYKKTDMRANTETILSNENEQRFLQALEHEDEATMLSIIDGYCSAVQKNWYTDKQIIVERAYDIVFILLRVLRETGVRLEDHILFEGISPKHKLASFEFFTGLSGFLHELVTECFILLNQYRMRETCPHAILQAREYIEENYMNNVSLSKLARHVGLSKSYFSSMFKKATGEGLANYIMRTRIEHGKQMLCSTSRTISEIANCTGFNSVYYFSNAFKGQCGMSPSEYRHKLPGR